MRNVVPPGAVATANLLSAVSVLKTILLSTTPPVNGDCGNVWLSMVPKALELDGHLGKKSWPLFRRWNELSEEQRLILRGLGSTLTLRTLERMQPGAAQTILDFVLSSPSFGRLFDEATNAANRRPLLRTPQSTRLPASRDEMPPGKPFTTRLSPAELLCWRKRGLTFRVATGKYAGEAIEVIGLVKSSEGGTDLKAAYEVSGKLKVVKPSAAVITLKGAKPERGIPRLTRSKLELPGFYDKQATVDYLRSVVGRQIKTSPDTTVTIQEIFEGPEAFHVRLTGTSSEGREEEFLRAPISVRYYLNVGRWVLLSERPSA